MKKKEDKKREVESLHELLENTSNVFVTGFENLTVPDDFQLRKAVRAAGGNYRVIKNRLAENAAEGTPAEKTLAGLVGMNSLAYTAEHPVALAKALTAYAKEHPTFTFKSGVVEGRAVDTGAIERLAQMPPRDRLFGTLLFLIQAPATYLARAVNGVGRNLAVVLDQGCKGNKFSS